MRDTPTEERGEFADVDAVPLHHALAIAFDGVNVSRADVVPFAVMRELYDAMRILRDAAAAVAPAATPEA